LRKDPHLLKTFFAWIVKTRSECTFSGTTSGEKDLIESRKKVHRRQAETIEKIRAITVRPATTSWDEVLPKFLPELRDTPSLAERFSGLHPELK